MELRGSLSKPFLKLFLTYYWSFNKSEDYFFLRLWTKLQQVKYHILSQKEYTEHITNQDLTQVPYFNWEKAAIPHCSSAFIVHSPSQVRDLQYFKSAQDLHCFYNTFSSDENS